MITKGICADCGKECDKRAKRCRECHTNNVLNKSPNRGKNKRARSLPLNYCIDCGEEIKYDSVRCNKCHPKWLATQESWLEGNKERVQEFWDNVDEEWYEDFLDKAKEAGQKRVNDPEWIEAQKRGMEELRNDPERWQAYLETHRENTPRRENHYNWHGGVSFEPYGEGFNNNHKAMIRDRDNHICQLCSKSEEDNGEELSIHHVDYDKNNHDPDNLISLCRVCHTKTNHNRKRWKAHFQKMTKGS